MYHHICTYAYQDTRFCVSNQERRAAHINRNRQVAIFRFLYSISITTELFCTKLMYFMPSIYRIWSIKTTTSILQMANNTSSCLNMENWRKSVSSLWDIFPQFSSHFLEKFDQTKDHFLMDWFPSKLVHQ